MILQGRWRECSVSQIVCTNCKREDHCQYSSWLEFSNQSIPSQLALVEIVKTKQLCLKCLVRIGTFIRFLESWKLIKICDMLPLSLDSRIINVQSDKKKHQTFSCALCFLIVWLLRLLAAMEEKLHWLHWWGFSPVCLRLWFFRSPAKAAEYLHWFLSIQLL